MPGPKASTGLGERTSTAALQEKAAAAEKVANPPPVVEAGAAPAEPPPKPYKPEPITAERMKDAEQTILSRVVNCDSGTEVDHLSDPSYWTHVAATMRPRTQIRAYGYDETWRADLEVVECGRLFARVKLLHYYDLTEGVSKAVDTAIADSPYYAKYLGAQDQWGVVRRSDQAKMEADIGTRDQAQLKARQMSITHTRK
jgi:hypothetical protein